MGAGSALLVFRGGVMNLDKLQVNACIRSGWQAVDLGFLMAQAWWRQALPRQPVVAVATDAGAPAGILAESALGTAVYLVVKTLLGTPATVYRQSHAVR